MPQWSGAIRVEVDPDVWRAEVERLKAGSPARVAAERDRARLEQGLRSAEAEPCLERGPDGTRLAGHVKAYVPLGAAPASERPYGFVFALFETDDDAWLVLIAFGERHPENRLTRSVYERAHKRLHRRYPDQ